MRKLILVFLWAMIAFAACVFAAHGAPAPLPKHPRLAPTPVITGEWTVYYCGSPYKTTFHSNGLYFAEPWSGEYYYHGGVLTVKERMAHHGPEDGLVWTVTLVPEGDHLEGTASVKMGVDAHVYKVSIKMIRR